ncbi:glycosyltransferase family 2 protein [Pedobacter psychrotolerans]|uniref:glycosyltransferase family 2 protein n=1 Tax=Pedobacter psychrotolerans TaxID=1843235 RepID=UPI003F952348
MKISIVTINYNHGEGLLRTINSVVNQTYNNIEYIIIDGGSSDSSIRFLNEYDTSIDYWISESDNGIYHAMNKGIEKSSGDYVLFLNSGDYLADLDVIKNITEKIKHISKFMTDDTIFYGNIIVNGKIIPAPSNITLNELSFSSLPHPATFIPLNLFNKLGKYNEDYKIISDWIFFLDAYLKQISFVYINYAVTIFELNGISSDSIKVENEKRTFMIKNYPNLIADFETFASFNIYKFSRVHKYIEITRSSFNFFFKKRMKK